MIVSTKGICGGEPCVQGTRINVAVLVMYKRLGCSDKDLLTMYPSITQNDLTDAWNYYKANKKEINNLIEDK
jgi:uncharacterized protein (DUF433 family)